MPEREYYSGNYYLNQIQMEKNATYLCSLLLSEGWTMNAIAGAMGNFQAESTINPGIWQSLKAGRYDLGYGLAQWTPATKYTEWCTENEYEWGAMESAVLRLRYELETGIQWVKHKPYPMTFREFVSSNEGPYYLAMVWLHNYEMPEDLNQPKRGTYAEKWYTYLTNGDPPPISPDHPDDGADRNEYPKMKSFIIPILKRRR